MPTLAAWINTLSPEQIAKEIAKAQAENDVKHAQPTEQERRKPMKVIAVNGDYSLAYFPEKVNRYAVYKTSGMSPSGDLKLKTMVAQSSIFSKHIKSYFTPQQVQSATARVHGMKYAKKFSAQSTEKVPAAIKCR